MINIIILSTWLSGYILSYRDKISSSSLCMLTKIFLHITYSQVSVIKTNLILWNLNVHDTFLNTHNL